MKSELTRTSILASGLLALAGCASSGGPPTGAEAERLYAGLSGSWVLVAEESGTLEDAIRNAESKLSPETRASDSRRARVPRQRALDPRGAPEATARQPDRMVPPAALKGVMRMCERLDVTVDGDGVVLDPEGFETTRLTFGSDARRETMGTLEVDSKAEWRGTDLLVERHVDEGPRVTQALRVAEDGNLHVEWTIDTGARVMRFVQVYTPGTG
jgi:hypothetical protein